jgi:hypothetical protein
MIPSAQPSKAPVRKNLPSTPAPVTKNLIPSTQPSKAPVRTKNSFEQGNTVPAINGQTANLLPQGGALMPKDTVCGAVQAVLAHPTNVNICFAGTTNGGVWRTNACTADKPVWEPLTDFEESLSVGDMVFDPSDATGNTVAVAVGRRSSYREVGGIGIGLLYTENALATTPTWRVFD